MTKPTKPRAKVRKPRNVYLRGYSYPAFSVYTDPFIDEPPTVSVDAPVINRARDCRRIADALYEAADYLEAKEKGGG